MTKSTVSKIWIGGLVTFVGGLMVAGLGVLLMLINAGTWTQVAGNPNSYNFQPTIGGFFWFTVVVIVVGGLIGLAGSIVQLVAWIGALVNSYWLPDKTWFWIVLIGGVASFFFAPIGLGVMIAYVIAAPDGMPFRRPQVPAAQAPTRLAPTS